MAKSKSDVQDALRELREFVDEDGPDKMATRIAYELECIIRWVTENTVDWPRPLQSAKDCAHIIREDIKRGDCHPTAPPAP